MSGVEQVLIMAGGTGGHVFPALAVAAKLRQSGLDVSWLGSTGGIEERLVPERGFALHLIQVSGIRGKGLTVKILAPWRLIKAVWQANRVFGQVRPSVVLGFGGFASGPGGLVAWLRRKPLIVHEQNAVAGTTNKWLSHLARRVLSAFPDTLPGAEIVGNPVRDSIEKIDRPERRLGIRTGAYRILVLGGSQGARFLNETLPAAISQCEQDVEVWHQCGDAWLDEAQGAYERAGVKAQVDTFIEDMSTAYGWADLVVCRAGAMTVAELAAAGVPSVLVPFPFAIDDHQTANGLWLSRAGAAVVVQERDTDSGQLAQRISSLLQRDRLMQMAVAARQLAFQDAADHIATLCREEI